MQVRFAPTMAGKNVRSKHAATDLAQASFANVQEPGAAEASKFAHPTAGVRNSVQAPSPSQTKAAK